MTLTSAGAAATASVAGSPYPIIPSAAVGTGLANYTITYVNGALTVTAATLTITANDQTKTYGTTLTFAGTEFTATGLAPGDTVTAVTLISAGAPATATVAGSPYPITPSAAVGTGLANYTITYVHGRADRHHGHPDHHRDQPDEGLRHDVHLRRDRVHRRRGLRGERPVTLGDARLVGCRRHRGRRRQPVPDHALGRGRHRSRQLHDRLRRRRADGHHGRPDDHRDRPDQDVRHDVHVRRHRVHRRPAWLTGDTVTLVTLTSAGRRPPPRSPAARTPIIPSAAVGTGLANYTITYVDGALTVTPAALTITADDQTKASGVRFVFTGTEFSTTGLVNGDTVDSATITSAGLLPPPPPATYPIDISAAVGTGLANYTITVRSGRR